MGMYSTDVNMEFGTTLRFKKEYEHGILTFPVGEEVRVASYVHKYYVKVHHKRVSDLVVIKIEDIDDLLEEVDTSCIWGYDSEFEHSHYISKCGFEFQFSDDRNSPTEYDFNFCPKCGKKIMEFKND